KARPDAANGRCIVTPSSKHNHSGGGNPPVSSGTPPALDPAQIRAHFDWWFGRAVSDPELPAAQIVLAMIRPAKGKNKDGGIYFTACSTVDEAVACALEESLHVNVYTHAALHGHRPNGKGSNATALCLPGVVADNDAQSPFRGSNEGKAPSVECLR